MKSTKALALVCFAYLLLSAGTALAQAQASDQKPTEQAPKAEVKQVETKNAAYTPWSPPDGIALYSVPIIVLFGSLIAVLVIRKSLPDDWSLADALSEEVSLQVIKEVTTKGQNGVADVVTKEPLYDKEGKPVLAPVLKASSSRLIALMGMIAILFMFIGFGSFALYGFGKVGALPESTDKVVNFLVGGMTLFAPYLVNKFASLFQGLTGGK